jgi:nucleoside-diphosphate-sugar epimerase
VLSHGKADLVSEGEGTNRRQGGSIVRIFITGGSGVVGTHVVPALVERGHEVTATTTTPAKAAALEAAGGRPLVLDLLDRDAVAGAVAEARPDVVVHQATALSGPLSLRHFDRSFAQTNRLRTAGTDNLLAAALGAGSRRFVAQSFTGWPNAREGGPVKTEADALDPRPPAAARGTLAAIRSLEAAVAGCGEIEGVVLRYGALYGPGTSLGAGGDLVDAVRRGRLPLVGDAGGVWSFLHVGDMTQATVAAIEGRSRGVYNVVDDDPAPVAEWLPYLAHVVGGRRPRRVPVWLARLLIGEHGVAMMTEARGSSNAKAKRELGWQPAYPSWREGFAHGLEGEPESARRPAA